MRTHLAEKKHDLFDQPLELLAQQSNVDIGHRTVEDRTWKEGDFGFISKRLIKFMDAVLYSKLVPFSVEWTRKRRRVSNASPLANYYRYLHQCMDLRWDGQAYSPDLELFFECFRSHPTIGYCLFTEPTWPLMNGVCEADVFNDFVAYLRQQAMVKNTKKRMSDWRAAIKYEKKSICRTVMKFAQFSKVLVIRVDMGYLTVAPDEAAVRVRTAWDQGDASAWSAKGDARREHGRAPENRARIDADVALADRARFFANQRGAGKELFEYMIGYIIKCERSDAGPYHFHCLFFFDGQKVQSVKYWTKKVEEYWGVITEGRGYVHNCHINQKKEELKKQGRWVIGKIRGRDSAQLEKLARYAHWYFAKIEQQVRIKPKTKSKLLTMGMVKKRKMRLGGPERRRTMRQNQRS